MKEINSTVFGKVMLLDPTDEDFIKLKDLAEKYPADAFGIVNKLLNKVGLAFTVTKIFEDVVEVS